MGYSLGNVASHVSAAATEVGQRFGYSNIGGYRSSGSVPGSDHPKGLALDFMTLDKSKGDATVAYLIENAQRLGITYIIYWRRIWQNGTWSPYSGPSPHVDHVHASFSARGGTGGVPIVDAVSGVSIPILGDISGAAARLVDPAFWRRVGLYALGIVLIIVGALTMFSPGVLDRAEQAVDIAKVVK